MVKVLQIFSEQIDGKENKFPDGIKIYDFSYTGSRMAIPSLSATLKYHECLDSKWDYSQYVEFRGEKYWVSKIPSSTKDNTDHRYKHDITFLSERSILSNVYFYDVVDAESEKGKYHSNSSSVLFYGTLSEFISRINASLRYSGINYSIVLDNAINNNDVEAKLAESKEFSCENAFVLDVLNQAYETWDIPFYFIGKVCHFGYFSYEIDKEPLQYGVNNSLLKIERTNANTRIVTRATGVGSTENIPFYYPNDSEKGNFTFETDIEGEYEIIDHNKLANSVDDGVTYTYTQEDITPELDWTGEVFVDAKTDDYKDILVDLRGEEILVNEVSIPHDIEIYFTISGYNSNVILTFNLDTDIAEKLTLGDVSRIFLETADGKESIKSWSGAGFKDTLDTDIEGGLEAGGYRFRLVALNVKKYIPMVSEYKYRLGTVSVESNLDSSITRTSMNWWKPNNDTSKKFSSLKSIGIDYNEEPPHLFEYNVNQGYSGKDINKKFTLKLIEGEKFVYQDRLMPSIYSRGSAFDGAVNAANKGVERYYDAKNGLYSGIGDFVNELNRFNRSENIYTYDDIKPTIENVENIDGYFINEIVDVAFDENDNDSVLGEEYGSNADNYAHPYFYAKIRRTRVHNDVADKRNDFNFNLFNRANEKDSMTIQMTSGDLNGCKFKVQVVEDKGDIKNPIQVYTQSEADNGLIPDGYSIGEPKKGDKEDKVSQSSFVENQQDTKENEVWLVLMKDQDTFGIILPSLTNKQVVKAGDTFNIIGISMPKAYIIAAEQKLDNHIVKDMHEENKEYFNYSIDFSRIFLKEDYDINTEYSWASLINETVKLPITYNGISFYQYVSSYTYECRDAELLPKITVELSNTIAKSETFEENIVRKSTSRATRTSTRVVFNSINEANYATTKSVSLKANQSESLEGYGIKDAYIKADGTIVLGKDSIKPATSTDRIESLDWSQITNKPDYFEEDGDGNIKVKNGKGLYSDSFISAGGVATEGGGSGGVNLTQMWESLQTNNDTFKDRLINVAHIPTLTTGKISDFVSATQAIADTAVANKADKATTIQDYGLWEKYTDLNDAPMGAFFSGGKSVANSPYNGDYISGITLARDINAEYRTQLSFASSRVFIRQESGANNWGSWHEVAFKGTTLAEYGITDAVKIATKSANVSESCVGYTTADHNLQNGGLFTGLGADGLYGSQLLGNYVGTGLYYRGKNNGDWTDWKELAFKATTLAGYGITDAVTLNTDQTISGEKTFSKFKVSNKNLVTNLNANMVGGYISSVLFTCESGYGVDVNAPHRNKKSGPLLYRISDNCGNIPPSCTNGVLVHFNSQGTDTAFQLVSNYSNTVLYYRSGNFTDGSSNYLYGRTWRKIAFTDTVLPLTGGTLTGALTVNAPINNTGALKLLGASEVSSTGMAVHSGAKALGSHANALGYYTTTERQYQTVIGCYNEPDTSSLFVIGAGSNEQSRKNAFTVDSNGYVRMGNRLFIGVGGKNEVYFNSDVADQLYVHTSAGIPFLIQGDFIRRDSSAPTTTLGTDQYKWFNVFTEALKIADANLTYDIGTLTVDKALKTTSTLTAPQGVFSNYIKIGNATISWNPKGYLVIDEGLASHKFISAGGVVTGDAGGGAGGLSLTDMWVSLNGNIDAYGKSKIHIDHIPLDVILSHDSYENDVANRINTFNYSDSISFTSAVKALIVADNIPTLEMSKIDGLEDTLSNIGTVVQNNYDTLNALITNNHKDHEARIKAIEQALTWQTV